MPTFRARWLRRTRTGSFWMVRHWTPPLHLAMGLNALILLWIQLWPTDPTRVARYVSLIPLPPPPILGIFESVLAVALLFPAVGCHHLFNRWPICRSWLGLMRDLAVIALCFYLVSLTALIGAFQVWVGIAPSAWSYTLWPIVVGAAVVQEIVDFRSARAALPWSATVSDEVAATPVQTQSGPGASQLGHA